MILQPSLEYPLNLSFSRTCCSLLTLVIGLSLGMGCAGLVVPSHALDVADSESAGGQVQDDTFPMN